MNNLNSEILMDEKTNYLITMFNYTNTKCVLLWNLIKENFKNKLDYYNNRLNLIDIENSYFLL